jgi:STAS-like domain of unknown function (DUF4325)
MPTIKIASDFSRTPGGRYFSDGPFSGQMFRDRYLVPALQAAKRDNDRVTVVLDGTRGYLSSFLEEVFGGLVRETGFSHDELDRLLEIRSDDPFYEPYRVLAKRYIAEARARAIAS